MGFMDLWEVQVTERSNRYKKQRCWAIMPDGSQCTGTRRSSKPWTGPGSRDGKIALCNGHNTHFLKYGEPRTHVPLKAQMPMTFEQRVEHYMNPVHGYIQITPYKCFEWQRTKLRAGYGLVNSKVVAERCGTKNNVQTHRMMWIYKNGPIPDGMQVHHNCYNTACCNPDHLELATGMENNSDAGMVRHLRKHYAMLLVENRDLKKLIKKLERELAKEKNRDQQSRA